MSRIAFHGAVRQREPRVRDKDHLGKVAKLPCIACLVLRGFVNRAVEVAHIKTGYPEAGWRAFGSSEKAHDWRTAPICSEHHRIGLGAQHQNLGGGEAWWWDRLHVYPPAFCQALVDAFAAGQTGEQVVLEFATKARRMHRGL